MPARGGALRLVERRRPHPGGIPRGAALRLPRRRGRTFSGRREVALGLAAYAVYLLARAAVFNERGRARAARNARRIEALERRLGMDVEPRLQQLLLPRRRLLRALGVGYVTLNVVLTVGSQMRLFFRRHPDFHRLRTATGLVIVGAQPAFLLFPTEPPRKLEHVVDTLAEVGGIDLERGLVVQLYNPIAAMPSIHLGFAVVTTAAVLADARSPAVRGLAVAYPAAVGFTVVVTGNHFVLDVVAGTALGLAALTLARRLTR